ncbi:MAG TPA: aminotransferase class V-fold PLP-dependent enzyme [Nocardioidaceae bacterium]|nr:aminotransferase class V-fold PLP-dependent enzyme [Nocardioidaceae bacterium]
MTNATGPSGAVTSGYLDAASSEPLHPAAREVLLSALDAGYADPLRLHHRGRDARLLLDNARAVVASCLGVREDEVSFTASGTQAVHLGVLGLLQGRSRVSTRLAHSAVEHSAVIRAGDWWTRHGRGTTAVAGVDHYGRVSPDGLAAALADGAGVLAVQSANHEVATLQPLDEVYAAASASDVPVFVDFAASAARVDLPPGWSAAAASAHKWGGPAGVGVLLVRKGARWRAPLPVDDRADSRISGFENVPAALAAAAALQARTAEREEVNARQFALVDRIRERVAGTVPDVEVVGDPVSRLPHLVTFSCLYVDGEALVTELDREGFGVASGSACTASTLTPSHVLEAMGALTHGNVRVSLTRDTTEAEVDRFLDVLPGVVSRLRERAGVR